jgi:superfamily II DNA or RNA helicase
MVVQHHARILLAGAEPQALGLPGQLWRSLPQGPPTCKHFIAGFVATLYGPCNAGLVRLRPYQCDAIEASEQAFVAGHRRVLIVSPTGTGKTVIFNEVIRMRVARDERVLLLAHREELIRQAATKLYAATGIVAAVEMAELKEGRSAARARASARARQASLVAAPTRFASAVGEWLAEEGTLPAAEAAGLEVTCDALARPCVVIASVQSMIRRLDRHTDGEFKLVIIDEAHHSTAETYDGITAHFPSAQVLGVTATPHRGDKVGLSEAFDHCAFSYSLPDAVLDGWLVPIRQRAVKTSIDLSAVRTVAGDLNQKQLAAALSELGALHEVAGPIVAECFERQTIVFAVTVAHAHLLATVLREHMADRARELGRPEPGPDAVLALDGTAEDELRRTTVRAFHEGRCRLLVNCALFTEGFDAPGCDAIAMARPTKSLGLYLQMLGRGTRPLAGVVDACPDRDQVAERTAAIAGSRKPDLLVLDFVENSKHKLIRVLDALAGDGKPEKALAKAILERGDIDDVLGALAEAKRQISEMEQARLRAQARLGYRGVDVPTEASPSPVKPRGPAYDPKPFRLLGYRLPSDQGRPISEAQASYIASLTRGQLKTDGLTTQAASNLIDSLKWRRDHDLAGYAQLVLLVDKGIPVEKARALKFEEARGLVRELSENGMRTPRSWGVRFGRFRNDTPSQPPTPPEPTADDDIPF